MKIIEKARREFIAKVTADLGKTIFAVGLAGYFFEKFSPALKVLLWFVCILSLISSIFIQPREKGE